MKRLVLLFLTCVMSILGETTKNGHFCYGDGPVTELFQKSECRFFTVVIDAGSTGTRLHLYRFRQNPEPVGLPFLVEEEVFYEVKPGLSSYNSDISGAASSVGELLEVAHKTVPHFLWEKTPVTLRATAGLRLLPGDLADDILEAVEEVIFNSGFYAVQNAVNIMSGSDEGLYSWFTLNILLHALYPEMPNMSHTPVAENTVAAFDLGGGSTQVTFWPGRKSQALAKRSEFERQIDFFGTDIRLFTHSFLGNGLIAARLNVLQMYMNPEDEVAEDADDLLSPCLPHGFSISPWQYALKNFSISGNRDYSFTSCLMATKKFVRSSGVMELPDLHGHLVYLFSYFFDRGLNAGLVTSNAGGPTTVRNFEKAAKIACERSSTELAGSHWLPWQCHDLTYIYSLLHHGYGFSLDQPIFLAKKIRGMEVAWAQGVAFSVADSFRRIENPSARQGQGVHVNNSMVGDIVEYLYHGTTQVLAFFNILS